MRRQFGYAGGSRRALTFGTCLLFMLGAVLAPRPAAAETGEVRFAIGPSLTFLAFAVPGLTPEREITVKTEDGLERKVFLYTVPLKKAKTGP